MEVQNFLARQTIKTDLHVFSGNYEEWQCFYANFVHTNRASTLKTYFVCKKL